MADLICRAPGAANPLVATIRMRFKPDDLEGVRMGLRLAMNSRSFRWYASIFNAAGQAVAESVGLVHGADILEPFRARADLPPGQFFVIDTTGADESPRGFGAWRERWSLRYRLAADVSRSTTPRVV